MLPANKASKALALNRVRLIQESLNVVSAAINGQKLTAEESETLYDFLDETLTSLLDPSAGTFYDVITNQTTP